MVGVGETEITEQQDSWIEEEWATWLEQKHEAKPAEAKDKQKAKGTVEEPASQEEAKVAKGES